MLRTFLIICLCLISLSAIRAQEVQVLTEDYPPYSYQENGEVKGFVTDIVREIIKRTGSTIIGGKIQLLPWARAYANATLVDNALLYTTARTPQRESLFKWVGPVSERNVWLYKLKKRDDIQINSIDDLRQYSIGAYISGASTQFFLSRGLRGNMITSSDGTLHVKQLFAGRIDVITGVDDVITYRLNQLELDKHAIEKAYLLVEGGGYYLAFSKAVPDEVVKRFQAALDNMKTDGTYDRIKARYIP